MNVVARSGRATGLLLLVLTLTGCAREQTEEPTATVPSPVHVRVAAARRGEIDDVRRVSGQTAALRMLRLASPVGGRVTFISAQPGDHLAAGAIAARVLPVEDEAAVNGLGILEHAGALQAGERERARRLDDNLRGGDIPLRTAFDAIVSTRLRNPGELVAANDVVMELFDERSLYVVAQIPVEWLKSVAAGMTVDISAGQVTATGHVETLLPAVDAQALTVPVRVVLDQLLQPPVLSVSVDCRITIAHHPNALLIPRTALLSSQVRDDGDVMVASNGKAQRRSVRLGLRSESEIEVRDGLADGDLVIVEGHYALPEDAAIEATADVP